MLKTITEKVLKEVEVVKGKELHCDVCGKRIERHENYYSVTTQYESGIDFRTHRGPEYDCCSKDCVRACFEKYLNGAMGLQFPNEFDVSEVSNETY